LAAYKGTDMGEVIESFVAFTAKVESLRHFVMLNLQAVVKITKKHDKHSDTTLQSDLVQEVHNRNFFKSQRFGQLIMDIEKLATQIMSRLTGDLESNEPLRPAGVYDGDNLCPTCLEQLCNPILVLSFLALLVPKYEY